MFGRVGQQNNVCRFYQQGRCKFGDGCKYEHPGANRQQGNQNSFAALSNNQNQGNPRGNNNNNRPSGLVRGDQYRPQGNQQNQPLPYLISKEGIESDLTKERPQWPFSAYGPGRDAPRQLFGGYPLEQSFEEMRVMYYLAQAQGNVQTAIQFEQELLQKANQQVEQVLHDLDGAVQYVLAGKDEHPNRLDMCVTPGTGAQPPQQAPFGNPAPSGSAFGQPSSFGANAPKPAFGAPAFGAPSQPTASGGFGQPSALGRSGGFGQPSSLGQGSAFGKPSLPGQGSAFGQPSLPGQGSAFGQPSAPGQGSAFGQPSMPGQGGAFGQASALGAKPSWGQSSASGQGSAFGQPSAPGQANALGNTTFGQSAFGQPSNAGQQASPFGQVARAGSGPAFGQAGGPAQTSAFGQASSLGNNQQAPAFGQPSTASQTGGFGQPSAFGQPAQTAQTQQSNTSPFGAQPNSAQQQPSPFGQAAGTQQKSAFGQPTATPAFGQPAQPAKSSPFGAPATSSPFAAAQQPSAQSPFSQAPPPQTNGAAAHANIPSGPLQSPDPSTYTTRHPNNMLSSWKNSPVQYIGDEEPKIPHYRKPDGTWERIFHPNGPPQANPDIEDKAEAYDAALEAAYAFVRDTGTFKDGIMPEVPPKWEWIRFDV